MTLTVDGKPAKFARRGMLVAVCTVDGKRAWVLQSLDAAKVADALGDGGAMTGADLEARGFRVRK